MAEAQAPTADVGKAQMVISAGQVSFVIGYLWTLALYIYAHVLHKRTQESQRSVAIKAHLSDPDIESKVDQELSPLLNGGAKSEGQTPTKPGMFQDMLGSPMLRCLLLDPQAVMEAKDVLLYMLEFGTIMIWFLLCDRTDLFWQAEKAYSRDLLLFLFLMLTIVAFATSVQPVKRELLLNRPQTEEWKGWMQVLFLLYHYYEAREIYNAIRIFIAGYVWMTGFGNFSYYYRTGDFSIGRFCQMMWRLNFMVFFCCVVLQNSYMLYYICPMHTIFTVFVYVSLAVGSKYNKNNTVIWLKLFGCVAGIIVLWDIKAVFYGMWKPFDWLVGYEDPRKGAGQDRMHEWYFRSGLDRYVWIWGMFCAFIHPTVSKWFAALEELPPVKRNTVRAVILAVVGALFTVYYNTVYSLPKREYNAVHPYTSWIPLTLFTVVRNLTPKLRIWSLRLYGWLGCITLETYLCQFHIWLHSDIPDGQPKFLLSLVPGYPLINFAVCTALYVYISHRLFTLTNELKDKFLPHDDNHTLLRNILLMLALVGSAGAVGWVVERALVLKLLV